MAELRAPQGITRLADRTISEAIENSVVGILNFALRLLRTTWVMFRRPLSGIQRIAAADTQSRIFVLPLTFLAIGGFCFTLVISAYPFGVLNLFDIIWFSDDISKIVFERINEAFTISGLLLTAFPVFVCVTICAGLAQGILSAKPERATFLRLSYYAFGYQTFVFFLPFVALVFADVLISAINGPYVEGLISDAAGEAIAIGIAIAAVLLMVSGLLLPIAALTYWRFQFVRYDRTVLNVVRLGLTPIYVVFVFGLVSYASSLPAVFADIFDDSPPAVEIDTVGDPSLILRQEADGTVYGVAQMNLVLHNHPASPMVRETRYVSLFLTKEVDGIDDEFWFADAMTIKHDGPLADVILIEAKASLIAPVSGEIELPQEVVTDIKEKAKGTPASNGYGLFLGLRFFHDGTDLERRIAFDLSEAVAGLP